MNHRSAHCPNPAAEALRELQQLQTRAQHFNDQLAGVDAGLERMRAMAEAALEARQKLETAHAAITEQLAQAHAGYLALVAEAQSRAVPVERTIQ